MTRKRNITFSLKNTCADKSTNNSPIPISHKSDGNDKNKIVFKRNNKQKYRKRRDDNDNTSINIIPTEISFQQETFDANMNDNGVAAVIKTKESEESTTNRKSVIKSSKIVKDLELVLKLYEEERHLVAYKLYRDSMDKIERLESVENSTSQTLEERMFLSKHHEKFSRLKLYAKLFQSCKEGMLEGSWVYSHSLFGISTCYRREKDNTLSIKLEGNLEDLPLFEQLAVLRELDLYSIWAPFVTSSKVISQLARCDLVGWYLFQVPFMFSRDALYRAISCDCLSEDKSVLIVAKGLADHTDVDADATDCNHFISDVPKDLNIPDPPKSWNGARMDINAFSGVINLTSPTSAKTKLVANFDLHVALLPQSFIEFALKKMCGILLHRMEIAAKHAVDDPLHSPHAIRIRQDVDFYQKWLWPKVQRCCKTFNWEMPIVKALEAIDTISTTDDEASDREHDHPHSVYHNNDAENASTGRPDDSHGSITTPISFWNQQKLKQQTQKEQKIKAQRQKVVELLRPTPMSPANKRRLQALEQKKHKLQLLQYNNNYNQPNPKPNNINYENQNEKTLKESLLFMSKPIILLLLELTLFNNLDNYDLFSSFGVIKGPDNNSYFQHKILSFIETVALMAIYSYFYSCTMHFTLLQIFNILETSVFHYQNEHALLEMKRQYATTIRTKFKSFTFIMILIWTLFCTLIYTVGSYDWTLFSYFGKVLLDTTKTFFIYSSTFMVSVVMFLSFLSDTNTKVDADTQEMLSSSQNILTTDVKLSESNDSNSVLSKHSGSGASNDPSVTFYVNDNDNLIDNPKNNKPTGNKIKNKKTTGIVLAKKSKYDVLKMHMKAVAFTYTNKIIKKKSNQSSTHAPNDTATKSNEHNDHEILSSPPHPIKRRKLFQIKKKQTHDQYNSVFSS